MIISNESVAYCQASEVFCHGDLLVQIGYRECDTIEHGNIYYREALKHYLLPMKYVKEEEYFSKFGFLEDRILLLLVALGGDRKVIVDWCQGIGNRDR